MACKKNDAGKKLMGKKKMACKTNDAGKKPMAKKTAAKTVSAAPKPKPAPAAAQKRKKETPSTEFVLHAPDAKEIFVAGDFDEWKSTVHRMRRYKGDIWKKRIKLKPGRYEYRFIVDGQWWSDPQNTVRQPNPFGSENSVINITS